ncbi:hypothetical protein [Saccharococcus thermophilus]|uniref:Putative ArsR family transcriptional regulator n=1 Tax=Saccharococcus thermophilus TaxID=29396 RepID=A0A846ME66_9BACL|nr:hypothetical protein [Saccharococcus thermophilus]NIK15311.1 putative ArsR family transcriptional regulator [Saccharococcus thermophilus]
MMNKMQLLDKLKTVVETGDTEKIRQFLDSEEGKEIRQELEKVVSKVCESIREIVAYLYKVFKENEEPTLSLLEENKKD